jgi:hypothetical protein
MKRGTKVQYHPQRWQDNTTWLVEPGSIGTVISDGIFREGGKFCVIVEWTERQNGIRRGDRVETLDLLVVGL